MTQLPNDDVRQRKGMSTPSTQHALPIVTIHNDTVVLSNGGLRAVLHVESSNFNLKSETEQEAIIAGYGAFFNTLSFPIQVLIRSTHVNIDPYLAYLRSKIQQQKHQLLLTQTAAHLEFIVRLMEVADIMQKKFYLVLPADQDALRKTFLGKLFPWHHYKGGAAAFGQQNPAFLEGARTLKDRMELVQSGLNAIGLRSSRLRTRELIQLYYEIYNPKTSQRQKIPQDIADLHTDAASF